MLCWNYKISMFWLKTSVFPHIHNYCGSEVSPVKYSILEQKLSRNQWRSSAFLSLNASKEKHKKVSSEHWQLLFFSNTQIWPKVNAFSFLLLKKRGRNLLSLPGIFSYLVFEQINKILAMFTAMNQMSKIY